MALEIYLKNENSVKESAWYQCWEEKINNPSFIQAFMKIIAQDFF
jgi:hypothetical protein